MDRPNPFDDENELYDDEELEDRDPESLWEEQKHWGHTFDPGKPLTRPITSDPPVTRKRNPPPSVNLEPERPKLNPLWRERMKERARREVERRAFEKFETDQQRILGAVKAKWKRRIRRAYLKGKYKTDWIREILNSNPHKKSVNFKIKENLIREVNQYMLDILDCLTTDAMSYRDAELLVRHNKYGLRKIQVQARVGKKRVAVWRVPILVELNVPFITERINIERAKKGLRPIKGEVIKKSIQGLEREGFIVKVGKKHGMKGRLRMIGSFYVREVPLMVYVYDNYGPEKEPENKMKRAVTSRAYFWGSSQPEIRERLARLEPSK